VILPDHIHCIWTLPGTDTDYPTRWRLIKSRFSRTIEPTERLSERRIKKGERGIWQRRYWEHVIRDEVDLAHHTDYIHYINKSTCRRASGNEALLSLLSTDHLVHYM